MERITQANCVGPARYGHEFRYRLAAGFVGPGIWVLDAACGTGYGSAFLSGDCEYLGIDNIPHSEIGRSDLGTHITYAEHDLERPLTFDMQFDVFLGFETIEHLRNYEHYVNLAHQTGSWILVSAPVVPTLHLNPHHVHDFEPGQLRKIFENEEWEHYQTVQQPSELSEIVVMRRRA